MLTSISTSGSSQSWPAADTLSTHHRRQQFDPVPVAAPVYAKLAAVIQGQGQLLVLIEVHPFYASSDQELGQVHIGLVAV